ncbi:MAG: hypothetical protein JSV33_04885 [bacterium]|nr:MAG: hypothetical protein JSV33_04885 [bacterium]
MKRILLLGLVCIVCRPVSLSAHFENASVGARSQAMGGAFVALADDGSALFINPAGMVTTEIVTFYGDYAEPPDREALSEARLDALLPAGGTVFGVGWYRAGFGHGTVENLLVLGVARRILEGTQGSFLSVGGSARIGRIAYDRDCDCPDSRGAVSDVTGDLGLILRPLPVISVGYAIETLREVEFEVGGMPSRWRRVHRWGITYFWENKVVVSFEQEHLPDRTNRQYGFALRTAIPLEVMAGFSEGTVGGGLRWVHERFRASIVFSGDRDLGVTTRFGLELPAGAGSRNRLKQ